MKKKNTWIKLAAAAAAVAGIAYLVVRYYDSIHAWVSRLCPCHTLEDDFLVDDPFTPDAPASEAQAEAAEAPAPAETPVSEEVPADAAVADESDFEQP